ncbi:MAG: hypothetical protein IPO20_05950 [Gammaproteobacteria bacterium]|nr:hypothetical protein [Gammaproteobacteria bacterium]
MPSTPALSVRGHSPRPLSKSDTLDFYRRELLASQYREAVLLRRIRSANTFLLSLGITINADPWAEVALTMDGLPVAPGV